MKLCKELIWLHAFMFASISTTLNGKNQFSSVPALQSASKFYSQEYNSFVKILVRQSFTILLQKKQSFKTGEVI